MSVYPAVIRPSLFKFLSCLLMLSTVNFFTVRPASAQVSSLSTFRGTATDSSGAVVAGVSVNISEVSTGFTRTATTNQSGDYELPTLPNGTYQLIATAPNFKTYKVDDIVLDAGQIRRVDIRLEVGDTASAVTVRSGAQVIETEGATIGGTVVRKQWDYAPFIQSTQSFPPLVALTPGIQPTAAHSGIMFPGHNGQVAQGLDGFTDDGTLQNTDPGNLQEMTVVAVNAPAEYSRVGNFNAVTKAGSNDIHGRVYYYHGNNSFLGARSFFSPSNSNFIEHIIGGEVGGPIKKNKTFFFANIDIAHNKGSGPLGGCCSVPTARMGSGDFSALLPGTIVKDPLGAAPFPGNIIPANRLNPLSISVQQFFYPLPNNGPANSLVNNYIFNFPQAQTPIILPMGRIDHNFSNKHAIFVRFLGRLQYAASPGSLPCCYQTSERDARNWVVTDTYSITTNLVNTARFGIMKNFGNSGESEKGFKSIPGGQLVSQFGLQGVNPAGIQPAIGPVFQITGFQTAQAQMWGVSSDDRNSDYADSLIWSVGRHVVKLGAEFFHFRGYSSQPPAGTNGQFAFNGSFSGYSYSDFLLGYPFTSFVITPIVTRTQNANEFGAFAQDTFKVSRKLSLEYGLRWDYFGAPSYADGLVYNWDRATGAIIIPSSKMNAVSPLFPKNIQLQTGQVVPTPARLNFRPRLGAAYRLTDHTAVRAGYGVYSLTFGRYGNISGASGPFQIGQTFTNGAGGQPLFSFPNPFPPAGAIGTVPAQSVTGYPLNLVNGYSSQFNVTLEHEFHNVGIHISYIGSRDHDLPYTLNINKPQPGLTPFSASQLPYPQFTSASLERLNGASKYNALLAGVKRRVGSLTLDANFQWNSSMSNILNLENPYAPLLWNRDGTTIPLRFSYNGIYELPFGRGQQYLGNASPLVHALVGGWRLEVVGDLESGVFFSPSFSGSDPSNTNTSGGLPDRIGNGNLPSDQRTLSHWFDSAAFTAPPKGRFGNSGVNILQGPGFAVLNAALFKEFPTIRERYKFELGFVVSNALNHPNFSPPFSNISSPGQVGQLNAIVGDSVERGGPRFAEIKARIWF